MTLHLRFAARSDRGLLREGNEDSVYAGPRLLAVADGMGGHAAGEVASALTIQVLADLDSDDPGPDLLEALGDALDSANRRLHDAVEEEPSLEGMGTTLAAVLSDGARLGMVHVGDSRAYLLREGSLNRITRDHTVVQALIDRGRITAEEAGHHPQRSLLTRALSGRDDLEMDLTMREARVGDRYLLCTDGLSGVVSDETLADTLAEGTPSDCVDMLIDLALRGGGPDNITVIVADVVEDIGTDRPIVAGAAAAINSATPPAEDTPAARAAASKDRTAGSSEQRADNRSAERPGRRPGRSRRRLVLAATAGAVILLTITVGGLVYIRSQYFVGVESESVAIFRGVDSSLLGVKLYALEEVTGPALSTLTPFERVQVEDGITASSRSDAEQIVSRIQDSVTPAPPAGSPSPSPTAAAVSLRSPATLSIPFVTEV